MYVVYRKIKKVTLFISFIGFSMHLSLLAQNWVGGIVRVDCKGQKVKRHPTWLELMQLRLLMMMMMILIFLLFVPCATSR